MAGSRRQLTAGALGVAAFALIAASTSVTGAYFSEAHPGGITGTIEAVHLSTTSTTFSWNMLPGEQKTATVSFRNKGTGNQDFYLVFPNGPALHALNNLGEYGELHVTGGKTDAVVPVFDSANLQDGRTRSDGTNSCGNVFKQAVPARSGCWPLPAKLKIASNVAPLGTGSLSFSFTYDGRLGEGSGGRVAVFNRYPSTTTEATPGSQAFGADADGVTAGNGLPYQIVATQVGLTP